MRQAPKFHASPAPTAEEAAAIAAALSTLLEEEAARARPRGTGGISPWVAAGRARAAGQDPALYRGVAPSSAWRLSVRA